MTATSSDIEHEVAEAIKEHLAEAVEEVTVTGKGRISVIARKETMKEVAIWLQHFGFDHAVSVSGVDHLTERKIEVLYFISSHSNDDLKHIILSLRVQVDRDNPLLPALTPIWESANLFEREAYEMFGVKFEGHPKLQKLLLQDNWDGPPPLRKDLKIPEMA